ncbi:MAG: hypothetical protein ABUT20_54400, partial [Bacteroidota bacterium]
MDHAMIFHFLLVLLSVMSALFATIVMSYIGMAVPIGPWVEATLVLMLSVLTKLIISHAGVRNKVVLLATAAGGIAGIAATGCSFSFPALYFLAPDLFYSLLSQPMYFSFILGGLIFTAGALGLVVAQVLRQPLIEESELPFPIGAMVQKVIVAQDQTQKSKSLLIGGLGTFSFLAFQQPIFFGKAI